MPLNEAFMNASPIAKEQMNTVPANIQEAWLQSYYALGCDSGWVASELEKGVLWIMSNPRRRPKVFHRFFVNWLSKAHEYHRKAQNVNKLKAKSVKDVLEELEDGHPGEF